MTVSGSRFILTGVLLAAAVLGSIRKRGTSQGSHARKQLTQEDRELALRTKIESRAALYEKDVKSLSEDLYESTRYGRFGHGKLVFNIKAHYAYPGSALRDDIDLTDDAIDEVIWENANEEVDSLVEYLKETFPWLDAYEAGREGRQGGYLTFEVGSGIWEDLDGIYFEGIDLRGRKFIGQDDDGWEDAVDRVVRAKIILEDLPKIEKIVEKSVHEFEQQRKDPWTWEPYLKPKALARLHRQYREDQRKRAKRKRAAAKGVRTRRRNRTAARRS